jgi:hypothetical protein
VLSRPVDYFVGRGGILPFAMIFLEGNNRRDFDDAIDENLKQDTK